MSQKNDTNLAVVLDDISGMLAVATETLEVLRERDRARAVKAAAAVIERRDIEVNASHIIAIAERTLARQHPPEQGKRTDMHGDDDHNFAHRGREVKDTLEDEAERRRLAGLISRTRQAHADIPDERFAQILAESSERDEPVTRAQLLKESRAIRRAQAGEPEAAAEDIPDPSSPAEKMAAAARYITELEDKVAAAEERAAIATEHDEDARLQAGEEMINSLRSQLANCMEENDRKSRIIAAQRAQIAQLKSEL